MNNRYFLVTATMYGKYLQSQFIMGDGFFLNQKEVMNRFSELYNGSNATHVTHKITILSIFEFKSESDFTDFIG